MSAEFQTRDHHLTLLQNGAEFFPCLCAEIDAARYSVYLETYLFAADETGRRVSAALQRAALRDVAVHLLLDGFGSAALPQQWVDELRGAGVKVRWFRRGRDVFRLRRYQLRRLHRKLAVIDGETAFVGGINIIDDIPGNTFLRMPRLDYAVRVRGRVAREVQAEMRRLWMVVNWSRRKRISRARYQLRRKVREAVVQPLTLLLRDIQPAYLQAMASAQREIIIANAYFLPGRAFRRAMTDAAQRGVRVVLLLQGRVEYRLQHYATQALYDRLLAAGIEVYEYQPSYLHAKVAVVDGVWTTVGSANIDPLSLLLAREANLVVRGAEFAGALRGALLAAIAAHSLPIELKNWRKQGWARRMVSRMSYAVLRLLITLLGMGKRDV